MYNPKIAYWLCLPRVTDELKDSILEKFAQLEKFYDKNKGKLLYEIKGDTPKSILEELLKPYNTGTVFVTNPEYFQKVQERLDNYFCDLHMGTINHTDDTEEDKAYERLFNQFRFFLGHDIPRLCTCINDWHERTDIWKDIFSATTIN
jgi:hypothetical protein